MHGDFNTNMLWLMANDGKVRSSPRQEHMMCLIENAIIFCVILLTYAASFTMYVGNDKM